LKLPLLVGAGGEPEDPPTDPLSERPVAAERAKAWHHETSIFETRCHDLPMFIYVYACFALKW